MARGDVLIAAGCFLAGWLAVASGMAGTAPALGAAETIWSLAMVPADDPGQVLPKPSEPDAGSDQDGPFRMPPPAVSRQPARPAPKPPAPPIGPTYVDSSPCWRPTTSGWVWGRLATNNTVYFDAATQPVTSAPTRQPVLRQRLVRSCDGRGCSYQSIWSYE